MSFVKKMFKKAFENKMAVVEDYMEVKLMEERKHQKDEKHHLQEVDQASISSDSASGGELQKASKYNTTLLQGINCPMVPSVPDF